MGRKIDKSLSPKEQQVLDIIIQGISENGYPPTVREIGDAVGFSSSSTVQSYVNTLQAKGYLRRDPLKPRALKVSASQDRGQKLDAVVDAAGEVIADFEGSIIKHPSLLKLAEALHELGLTESA